MCCCSCWLSTPLKGVQVKSRNKALCALGKTGRIGPQIVDIFRSQFYELNSCISSYLEKILHGDVCFSWLAVTCTRLAETFCKKICAWLHVFLLHQNHIFTDRPPCLFGAVCQSFLKCCLPGCSPHFAPSKTSLTTLMLCIFSSRQWLIQNG